MIWIFAHQLRICQHRIYKKMHNSKPVSKKQDYTNSVIGTVRELVRGQGQAADISSVHKTGEGDKNVVISAILSADSQSRGQVAARLMFTSPMMEQFRRGWLWLLPQRYSTAVENAKAVVNPQRHVRILRKFLEMLEAEIEPLAELIA